MFVLLSIFATVFLCSLATPFTPSWGEVRVKHSWSIVPDDWMSLGHPAADATIDLHIVLKAQDENALTEALYEVSSPDHPKYGKHLSKEQVAELVAPRQDVLELVHSWLEHHGVPPSTVLEKHAGSRVSLVGVPVSQANDLLRASYQLYQHAGTNTTVLRTLSYGLPEAMLEHVQTVEPTTYFGIPRNSQKPRMRRSGAAEAVPAEDSEVAGTTALSKRVPLEYITPDILRWMYRSASYVPTAANWNVIGVAGLSDNYPSPSDLMQFMKEFRTDGTYATYTVITVNGGAYNPSNPADEANLNVQFSLGIAYPIRLIFYSIGHTPGGRDPLAAWLEYMLEQTNVPQTISASYGSPEYRVSSDHVPYVCNLFAQLGARGASVLVSSGDDGVGDGNCVFNDGRGNSYVRFSPTFPASCPWVTSVGGTTGIPEEAAKISGGGFSAYFPRPPYQNPAVPTFLQNLGGQYSGLYNPWGRGVPDIALQAFQYKFVLNRQTWAMDGTSCSAPAAAGIIAMLNDYMITTRRKPLGFLNPWLYGAGLAGLNDITIGSNPGCNTPGFSAAPGWDPVTGHGTLDFSKLGELLSYGR